MAPETALKLQELLGGEAKFSLMELPRITLSVQPVSSTAAESVSGPVTRETAGGWRLTAVDESWHVNVEAGSVSIESSRYGSWSGNFFPRLQQVLDVLQVVGPPVIESRLGLRYINIVVGSAVNKSPLSGPGELSGVIEPWLLGPLSDTRLQGFVQMAQGRSTFSFENASAVLNHGVVSAENGELGYLVDIDTFRQGGRAFQKDGLLSHSAVLHEAALGLFQASLTAETLESMRSASGGGM